MRRAIFFLAAAALLIGGGVPATAGTVVYNLANDWSDTSNPNNTWSYRMSPTTILTSHLSDWDPPPPFTSPPQGWASEILPSVGHIPVFLKTVAADTNPNDDLPVGHVYMHNNDDTNSPSGFGNQPAGIFWTAPATGAIHITGDMWEVTRGLGRSEDWALVVNGQTISSGTLTPTDATSASPLDLASGTGGTAALSRVVNSGDIVALEFLRHPGTNWGTLMGVDLQFDLTPAGSFDVPVPEPSAAIVWSMATALFVAGALCKHPKPAAL